MLVILCFIEDDHTNVNLRNLCSIYRAILSLMQSDKLEVSFAAVQPL